MEEPESEKVEGGRVSIIAVCGDYVKEVRWKWKDVIGAKLKKTFLKRLEDVFNYKSGVKDDCFIYGICWKESWFAVYVGVYLAIFGKERKMCCDDFLKIWPKN